MHKRILLSTTAACLTMATAMPTYGQTVDGANTGDENIIVVTGTRSDLREALADKRAADIVSDVIVAEDIGNLPDQNIADSLQRVPGVQVQRNDRGQTSDVTIRGLPSNFTKVLYNGRPVSTVFSDTLRNRNFQAFIVPSTFVSKLGVAKTSKADVVEGGIAGTVDIVSKKAFDYKGRRIAFDARISNESNSGAFGTAISGLYADTFANDTIGFLIGVNYTLERPDQHRVRGGMYTRSKKSSNEKAGRDLNGDGDFADKDIVVRNNVMAEDFSQRRERISVVSNLEFRPSDDLSIMADVLYAVQDIESPRNSIRIDVRGTNTIAAEQKSVIIDGNEIVSRYASTGASVSPESELQFRDNKLLVGQLSMDWTTGSWEISASGGLTRSIHDQSRVRAIAKGPRIPLTADFHSSTQPASIILDDAATATLLDSSQYSIKSLTSGPGVNIRSTLTQYDLYLDFKRDLDWGFVRDFQFGGSYSVNKFDSNRTAISLNAAELATLGIDEYDYFVVSPGNGSFADAGNAPLPQRWVVPNVRNILNGASIADLIAADKGAKINNPADIVDVDEKFFAAYAQVNFGDDSGIFSGNLGLRYTHTDERVSGNSIDPAAGFTRDSSGELTPKAELVPVTRSRTYDDFMPSLNLRLNLGDEHVIRFGAARTVSRPAPSELDLVVKGLKGGAGEDNKISFNDPNLKPFRSNNFDLTWSWYYAPEAIFSVGLFQKDLKSLIGPRTIVENFPVTNAVTGVTADEPFTVTTDSNDAGVKLRGVEVQWQQPFTFLPGFLKHTGMKANYSFIDNSAPERLRAAAKHNYNLVAYYDDGTFDARVSYTRRGKFLYAPAVETTPDELVQAREFLVVNATYHLNRNLEIFVNAANLTNAAGNRFHKGGLTRQFQDFGRRFTFGITGKF